MSDIPEQAGRVATSAVETFRSQPGLLFLTIVNIAFLVFVYMVGTLVLKAYSEQQTQIHERYQQALVTVDRCIETAFRSTPIEPAPAHPPQGDKP